MRTETGLSPGATDPIAGVKVSDGINVTRTNKDGAFTLPGYDDTRFIFVTVPSGYFSLHPWIPAGSAQSYDFALQPRKEGEVIRFAQIADNETPESWRWVQALKDYARNEHLDFILHSGDICYEPGIRFHGDSVTTATMGVPVYYTMGNHDLMKKVPVPEYLYQENFGPVWYSFEAGNTHFIVLPMYIGDGKPTYTAEQNYRWLKNDLAHVDPDQNIVVVTHYNNTLGEQLVFKSKEGSIRFKDDDRFIAHILGHWHINHQRLIDGRIRYIVTSPSNKGGKDHSPSAFRVISIDRKGNISSENIYSYSRMNMAIVSPSRTARAGAPLRISVNAYNTAASVRRVDYTVTDAAGKNWAKGTLAPNTDWNYSTDVDLSKAPQGDTLSLKVKATCSDGTSRTLERRFAFGTLPSVNVSGQWAQLRGNEMHNDTIGTDQPVCALQLLWDSQRRREHLHDFAHRGTGKGVRRHDGQQPGRTFGCGGFRCRYRSESMVASYGQQREEHHCLRLGKSLCDGYRRDGLCLGCRYGAGCVEKNSRSGAPPGCRSGAGGTGRYLVCGRRAGPFGAQRGRRGALLAQYGLFTGYRYDGQHDSGGKYAA